MPVVVEPSSGSAAKDVPAPAGLPLPAEFLGGAALRDKVVTAAEAVRLIRDGDAVVIEGFVGQGFAEELTLALENRFLLTGTPRNLTAVFTVASGDRKGRGLDRLCHEGLLAKAIDGHWVCRRRWGRWPWATGSRPTTCPRGWCHSCSGTPPPASLV